MVSVNSNQLENNSELGSGTQTVSAVVRKDFTQEMGVELDPAESRVALKITYLLNIYQVSTMSWKTMLSTGIQDK